MEFIVFLILLVVFVVFLRRQGRSDTPAERPDTKSVSPWGTRHDQQQPRSVQGASSPPSRDTADKRQKVPAYRPAVRVAAPVSAPVIAGPAYVTDGDGLRIKKTEIRLFGVDAPEFAHPYGKKAKWALLALCKGQQVRAEVVGTDDHGRTVAKCFLPDGRDLSAEMVKQGLALDWAKFSGGIYRCHETADARKKLWLADARQKGRMHVWEKFEAREVARKAAGRT